MFVAVAAAGMLASCSSDSLTAGSDPINQEPQEDRVAIEIGVATTQQKGMTRGTGTTGGTADVGDENIWRGERVNVLMYEITEGKPTFIFTKDGSGANIYPNTSMVTPLEAENTASGIAKEPFDPEHPEQIGWNDPQYTYKVKYYPSTGRSDFWGYYLGGYGAAPAAPAGDGTLTMYANATLNDAAEPEEADAKYVATDFVIDGTHDLLVGKATSDNPNAYSAKAARAGVQPNITFKHLLSRLQFKAKAGNANSDGVKVTGIKVRSKKTGKMIVAYKYDAVTPANEIVWSAADQEAAYTALSQLELKQRNGGTGAMEDLDEVELEWVDGTPAVYAAVPAGSDLTEGNTYYTDNTGGGEFVSDGSQTDVAADTYFELTTPAVPGYGDPKSVGEALIVAPQDKYEIEVDYEMDVQTARHWYNSTYAAVPAGYLTPGNTYYTSNTGDGIFVADGTEESDGTNYFELTRIDYGEGGLTGPATPIQDHLITDLVRTATDPESGDPLAFAAGESYMITITLYGPEEIKITTTLTPWAASDDIEIGQD